MSLRVLAAVLGGMLCNAVQAAVPLPPPCEQLYLAVDEPLLDAAGVAAGPLLQALEKNTGLQLHVRQESRDAFDAGVLDMWLAVEEGSGDGPQPARVLQPPVWQEQLLLWVRTGELSSLESWPQLDGLRGGYWAKQQKAGVLQQVQSLVRLEDLRQQKGADAALQALLAGEIDFFLADDHDRKGALQQAHKDGLIEALEQPAQIRSYHLALSRQSACHDKALVKRLEQALKKAMRKR